MSLRTTPDDAAAPGGAATSPRKRGRWSWLSLAGAGLLLTGMLVLGWVGWEFWGTNWVSHRAQHRVVSALHHQWAIGRPRAHVSGLPAAGAIVRIPRFGPSYAVPVLQGTSSDALAAGFGHVTDSAGPGQVGNYVLAGHRVTHGEPLRNMPDLRPGDRVIVETRRFVDTYALDTGGAALTVPFTARWVLAPVPANPDGGVQPPEQSRRQRLITLTTCSELFHTDNRLVAFGHLISRLRRN